MTVNVRGCQKGFTLVELLVVIAITGVIISAAYTFLFTNQAAYFAVMAKIEAQTDARQAMDNVITNIRRANQTELRKAENGSELLLKIPDTDGTFIPFAYTVEKNAATNLYELILTRQAARYVIATNIDGPDGFTVRSEEGNVIIVKIRTKAQKFNQISAFEMENSHRVKVEV